MEWVVDPQAWIGLITLTALELVLGIDNIIFIAILAGRLPENLRSKGRIIGLGFAMLTRIALLMSIAWITRLTGPLFTIFSEEISGRDLILLSGGLFLLVKSTLEIHASIESPPEHAGHLPLKPQVSFMGVIIQIAVIDYLTIFSKFLAQRPTINHPGGFMLSSFKITIAMRSKWGR